MNPAVTPVSGRLTEYGSPSTTTEASESGCTDTFNTVACGGEADYPQWDYQDVDGNRVRSITQVRDVPIVVYPFPNTPGKPFCDFLAEDWLYRGTGFAHINDNNVFWWMGTGGNNSFSVRVNGTVEGP